MLTNSPVVRSTGARLLFLLSAAVTVVILLWIHHLRAIGPLSGLTPIFQMLFEFDDYTPTVVALLILLVALVIPVQSPAARVFRWSGEHPRIIAVTSLLVLCVGSLVVYHNHPLSMDEYAQYFQSKAFAAGHLTGKFPLPLLDWLIPRGFQDFFLTVAHVSGRVASSYWPGFALLLTPFTWAGIPWACNPVISALTLLVIHRIALDMFASTEAAGAALLLTLASPVFFGMGISYYSMPAHLLANSVYVLLLIRPTVRKALAAGVVGSIALSLHNPVPHALFAAPWLIWIATRQGGMRLLLALCAGYLPLCLVLGIGWFEFSNQLMAEGAAPGQASGATLSRLQGIVDFFRAPSASLLLARWIGLAKVWIWAVPGLVLLACAGAWRQWANPVCRLLTASALLTLIAYLFVPVDQGHGWGYRYFHSAWLALPLLAAAALFPPARSPAIASSQDLGFATGETRSFVASCILLTLVFGTAVRAWGMQEFMARDLTQLPQHQTGGPRVVIVDPRFSFYGVDLVQNDPFLRGDEIRMLTHGAANDAAMMHQYFPNYHRVHADMYGEVWSP